MGEAARVEAAAQATAEQNDDESGEEAEGPVADLDIVEFLKEEAEAAVGLCLAESTKTDMPGLVAVKAPVYERREPKPDEMIGRGQIVVAKEGGPALPAGGRAAPKQVGHWAWGDGPGVSFSQNKQRK